ncbi:MAG TPA: hypothetical protein VMM56_04285 [Planctomycetaceae bacterium]|nr:hypothetical protein [Planctomycetaceae bacterium]
MLKSSPMKIYVLLIFCAFALSGCEEKINPGSKQTFPVTGVITVDGKPPGSPISISVHDEQGIDPEDPSVSSSLSQNDGSFALNTYQQGDGVPVGKYTLTFYWGTWNAISMGFGGSDRLNDRYRKVEGSTIKFEVDGAGPIDLGTIELTTE